MCIYYIYLYTPHFPSVYILWLKRSIKLSDDSEVVCTSLADNTCWQFRSFRFLALESFNWPPKLINQQIHSLDHRNIFSAVWFCGGVDTSRKILLLRFDLQGDQLLFVSRNAQFFVKEFLFNLQKSDH